MCRETCLPSLHAMIGSPTHHFLSSVQKSRLRQWSEALLVACSIGLGSAAAHATTLGPINTASALGEPFSAAISVLMPQGEPLEAECVRLMPVGGDLPTIPNLTFSIRADGDRTFSILLRSAARVQEPVAQLRLSVGCRNEIQRLYTVLLDPRAFAQAPSSNLNPSSGSDRSVSANNLDGFASASRVNASANGPSAPASAAIESQPSDLREVSAARSETRQNASAAGSTANTETRPRPAAANRSGARPSTLPRFELAPPPLARLQQAALASEAASPSSSDTEGMQTSPDASGGQLRLESVDPLPTSDSDRTGVLATNDTASIAEARLLIEQINSLTAQIANLQSQMDAARQAEQQRLAQVQIDEGGVWARFSGQGLYVSLIIALGLLVILLLLVLVGRRSRNASEPAISELLRAPQDRAATEPKLTSSAMSPKERVGNNPPASASASAPQRTPGTDVQASKSLTVSSAGMASRPPELVGDSAAASARTVASDSGARTDRINPGSSTTRHTVPSKDPVSANDGRAVLPELAGMTFERLDRNTLRAPIEVSEVELDPELLSSPSTASQTIDLTKTLPFGQTQLGTPTLGVDLELDTAAECNRVLSALLAVLEEAEHLTQSGDASKAAALLQQHLHIHPDSGPAPWLLLMHLQRTLGDESALLESGLRFTAHFGHEPPSGPELSALMVQASTPASLTAYPNLLDVFRELWGRPELLSFLYNEVIEPQDAATQRNYGVLKELMRLARQHGVPTAGSVPTTKPEWLI